MGQKAPTPPGQKRKARRRILHQIGKMANERGATAEDHTEEALRAFHNVGLVQFYRSEHMSVEDRMGIDFEVWLEPVGAGHFTIDVKSSSKGVEKARMRARNNGNHRDHHHFLLVEPGRTVAEIAIDIYKIYLRELRRH